MPKPAGGMGTSRFRPCLGGWPLFSPGIAAAAVVFGAPSQRVRLRWWWWVCEEISALWAGIGSQPGVAIPLERSLAADFSGYPLFTQAGGSLGGCGGPVVGGPTGGFGAGDGGKKQLRSGESRPVAALGRLALSRDNVGLTGFCCH